MVFESDELGLAPVGSGEQKWETFATDKEAYDVLVLRLESRIRQYWHGLLDYHELQQTQIVLWL